MKPIPTFDSERIFKQYVKNPEKFLTEDVHIGGDTLKFTEKNTGKTFIIMVREELKGEKVIVSTRKKKDWKPKGLRDII